MWLDEGAFYFSTQYYVFNFIVIFLCSNQRLVDFSPQDFIAFMTLNACLSRVSFCRILVILSWLKVVSSTVMHGSAATFFPLCALANPS